MLYIQIFSDSVCIKIAAKFKSKMLVMTKLANFYKKWTVNFIKGPNVILSKFLYGIIVFDSINRQFLGQIEGISVDE